MERDLQRRNSAKTSSLSPGQLAVRYLRYMEAGGVAGPSENLGGFGAIFAYQERHGRAGCPGEVAEPRWPTERMDELAQL